MNTNETLKSLKKDGETHKKNVWKTPKFITIKRDEIKKHVQAAARSGDCVGWLR